MAIKKTLPEVNACLFRDGVYYSELELNQVAFPFTGRIEAQTPLCAKVDDEEFIGEVGMILVVDKWGDTPAVRPMKAENEDPAPLFALNYSTELSYDERKPGLRYFYQKKADTSYDWLTNGDKDDIYPRLGYLSVGDRFTTSAIDLGYETEKTDKKEIVKEFKEKLNPTAVGAEAIINNGDYLTAGTEGYWVKCTDVAAAKAPVVRILDKNIGMADKSFGFRLEVVKA